MTVPADTPRISDRNGPDTELTQAEAVPPITAQLFGSRLEVARAYAEALVRDGETLGLLGPREYERLWTRHILNSVLLAPLVHGRVADVGSGAGLPGLPIAIARPDVEIVLIEPMERRSTWLEGLVSSLGLTNVTVIRARADEVPAEFAADVVTARAVAGLSKLIPWVAPLARYEGELLLLKGQGAEAEIEKATKQIRRFHLDDVRVEELGQDLDIEPTRVVRAIVR